MIFSLCNFWNYFFNTHGKWKNSKLCENTPPSRRPVSTQLNKLCRYNEEHDSNYISGWGGTAQPATPELRAGNVPQGIKYFLLYYSVILYGVLLLKPCQHVLLFAHGVFLLTENFISPPGLNGSHAALMKFVGDFLDLYGEFHKIMPYNVHLLTHLSQTWIDWEPFVSVLQMSLKASILSWWEFSVGHKLSPCRMRIYSFYHSIISHMRNLHALTKVEFGVE